MVWNDRWIPFWDARFGMGTLAFHSARVHRIGCHLPRVFCAVHSQTMTELQGSPKQKRPSMQKKKNDMLVGAEIASFLGGISTAIVYFELMRQIPMWDWGISLGVVLGLISAGLAFAVSRHPGASGAALTVIGLLLLVMSLISVGNLEPLIHGWHGALEHVSPARPWFAGTILTAGIFALAGNRELNPPCKSSDNTDDTMQD